MLQQSSSLFGLAVLWVVVMHVGVITQFDRAMRRNFPVVARCCHVFERFCGLFWQYFFVQDRAETPLNWSEQSGIGCAYENATSTVPLGSTRDLRPIGAVHFAHYPLLTVEQGAKGHSAAIVGR